MTVAVDTTAANVKPVNSDTIINRFTAGTGGTTAGKIVAMSTDGVILCDGSGAAGLVPVGIALQTVAATYPVDVVTHGAVKAMTGATLGSECYPVDGTAGQISHTPSTKKYSVGVAQTATIVFVRPTYVA